MFFFFFFNDTATTEIYTLSLHDALPISRNISAAGPCAGKGTPPETLDCLSHDTGRWTLHLLQRSRSERDRKSTRLNSSHGYISYAVFCLKKKKPGRMASSPTTYLTA